MRFSKRGAVCKPLALFKRLILAFSDVGATVCDPFCGSGITLRAARDLGRRAIGIEIEERYCEIAARRLAQGLLDLRPGHGAGGGDGEAER